MTGLRLNGGYDFSRSCAAQQSHTSAGTALQNALLGPGSARPCHDVSTAKEDRLWLPAQAAYHTTGLDSGPRPEEVKTQRLPTPPRPAERPPERPRPRRPATAHPRLQENRAQSAQTDPGVAPAGMRTPRAVRAWQSADAALAAEIHRRPVGGGADVAMAEDPGWTPHRQFAPEELRYNPITHQVDVFVNVDGDIQKCQPSAEEYRQMLVRLENAPPKKGRRKGLSECRSQFKKFVDLCCAGRARPNPHIKAAYAQNRRVFEKQRGPCTNMYEIAQGYPGRPRVFEPDARISNPGGQIPRPWTPAPTPVVPASPLPRGGNRVRRPQTARAPARAPETIHAPPSRIAERADDGG